MKKEIHNPTTATVLAKKKAEYYEMVKEVETINREAGLWLKSKAPFVMKSKFGSFGFSASLSRCFIFSESPQDAPYWHKIKSDLLFGSKCK